ncbi:hypothetical protein BST95_07755 [Halioglobus japonicus]|uniref:Uncharacterized protein n=1 Tax=Halioglobus japonicus TaxID=930805 RepID=A0AAP8SN62_9GAMM|nr:hypothetical protein [Halioglobus japonicus]AQA18149.1 hypothetical protein BST95_07755 [Halioglobus japonicus]PLW86146.1 hypothetical protein C0029_06795 [Halioglobus japonicus]GHD14206.1 hypothetical protein GCM10007052_17690 [Halioglobus japonicus]
MRTREDYLEEVETRLARMFRASRDGHKASPVDRHRLEGFIQAGSFLGLASKDELQSLMARVHFEVFGKSIEERQSEQANSWVLESIDYSQYDQPAYERGRI